MAENKILPWAQTSTANALSDADYAADVATGGPYADGVKSGQASSKQANKTWRQATAPGSGLAQFLVDNLGVDVTDADTPSTFSTRIANAVLKLAQVSPFNQAWASATGGYRKYAIVSDSSGNFWVSTADQNTTVPGASGAKWQSLFDGYATNEALNTETTNRTNADTNLQNQINNRVLKTGDTSTGSQFTRNKYDNGTLHWAPGWTSIIAGLSGGSSTGDYSFGMWAQALDGSYTAGILSVNGFKGRKDFRFNEDGNIFTPLGTVALTSDLPTDTVGTYNGYRYIKRVWNNGVIEQWFYTGDLQTVSGPVTVLFPQSYAVGVTPIVIGGMPTQSEDGYTSAPNFQNQADEPVTITNTGFTVINRGTNGSQFTCAFFVHVIG